LIALAIAAILVGLGAASWRPVVADFRLRAAEASVGRSLTQARLAALSTGRTLRVCPSTDLRHCASGATRGVAIVDERGSPAPGASAALLPEGVRLTLNRPAVTWYPWPRAASTVTLELCATTAVRASRRLIVSQAGRVRAERGAPC
ncbi:MAG: hypothetical protein EOP08_13360, partial [Proteobacteria bacterium]